MIRYVNRGAPVIASVLLVLLLGAMRERTPAEARVDGLEARIASLESRLAVAGPVQQGPQQWTVRAPFTVVDDAGKPVFMVRAQPRGLIVVDADGHTLVAASALPGNGFVKAINVAQNRAALIAADERTARVILRDGETADRITVTVGPNGRPELALNGDAHQPIVQLHTQVSNGGGELIIGDAKGKDVIYASAVPDGGVLKILNPSQTRVAVLGIQSGRAAVAIRDGLESSSDRITLGVGSDERLDFRVSSHGHTKALEVQDDSGGGRINLFDASGKGNASMGALSVGGFFRAQTPDGGRVAILGTETGNALVTLRDAQKMSRATMVVGADGKGTLALFNSAHQGIVNLTESPAGAGLMQLFSASGMTMVEAGTTQNGKGTVHAGPEFKCVPGNMGLTLPDCIMGHKP